VENFSETQATRMAAVACQQEEAAWAEAATDAPPSLHPGRSRRVALTFDRLALMGHFSAWLFTPFPLGEQEHPGIAKAMLPSNDSTTNQPHPSRLTPHRSNR